MGGHAFPDLWCPRIPKELYLRVRDQASDALNKLFSNVAVPSEMPDKSDYGDVDFLVSGFLQSPKLSLDWPTMVRAVLSAFGTTHCRQGHLNPDVIFCAIPAGGENDFWVQVDVKVMQKLGLDSFEWEKFLLHYASGSKMLGTLVKPLGMTIDPEGLHIRVEEMESTNFPGSMVFVSKKPWDLLRMVGLDRRMLRKGFKSNDEIYKYITSSWIFNPAHFEARLGNEKFFKHLEERSAPWVYFITEWIPKHFFNYRFPNSSGSLQGWYQASRATLREKTFTMFPPVASEYYTKRAAHVAEVEEQRLRGVLMKAIPATHENWDQHVAHPRVIMKPTTPATPLMDPQMLDDIAQVQPLTNAQLGVVPSPSFTPPLPSSPTGTLSEVPTEALDTPLYITRLPCEPPLAFAAHPPSAAMSLEAKLLCIARWTLFSSTTGLPYIACEPREKKFEIRWSEHGIEDAVLKAWVREKWATIWMRQAFVNYMGMWRRRFEKENIKAVKAQSPKSDTAVDVAKVEDTREETAAQIQPQNVNVRRKKILDRLALLGTLVS